MGEDRKGGVCVYESLTICVFRDADIGNAVDEAVARHVRQGDQVTHVKLPHEGKEMLLDPDDQGGLVDVSRESAGIFFRTSPCVAHGKAAFEGGKLQEGYEVDAIHRQGGHGIVSARLGNSALHGRNGRADGCDVLFGNGSGGSSPSRRFWNRTAVKRPEKTLPYGCVRSSGWRKYTPDRRWYAGRDFRD